MATQEQVAALNQALAQAQSHTAQLSQQIDHNRIDVQANIEAFETLTGTQF